MTQSLDKGPFRYMYRHAVAIESLDPPAVILGQLAPRTALCRPL